MNPKINDELTFVTKISAKHFISIQPSQAALTLIYFGEMFNGCVAQMVHCEADARTDREQKKSCSFQNGGLCWIFHYLVYEEPSIALNAETALSVLLVRSLLTDEY